MDGHRCNLPSSAEYEVRLMPVHPQPALIQLNTDISGKLAEVAVQGGRQLRRWPRLGAARAHPRRRRRRQGL